MYIYIYIHYIYKYIYANIPFPWIRHCHDGPRWSKYRNIFLVECCDGFLKQPRLLDKLNTPWRSCRFHEGYIYTKPNTDTRCPSTNPGGVTGIWEVESPFHQMRVVRNPQVYSRYKLLKHGSNPNKIENNPSKADRKQKYQTVMGKSCLLAQHDRSAFFVGPSWDSKQKEILTSYPGCFKRPQLPFLVSFHNPKW